MLLVAATHFAPCGDFQHILVSRHRLNNTGALRTSKQGQPCLRGYRLHPAPHDSEPSGGSSTAQSTMRGPLSPSLLSFVLSLPLSLSHLPSALPSGSAPAPRASASCSPRARAPITDSWRGREPGARARPHPFLPTPAPRAEPRAGSSQSQANRREA